MQKLVMDVHLICIDMESPYVSFEQSSIVLRGEGVSVRCKGEKSEDFSIIMSSCPKDLWRLR